VQPTEQFALLALILAPTSVIITIALLKGYHVHITKNRVTEHEKDKDE